MTLTLGPTWAPTSWRWPQANCTSRCCRDFRLRHRAATSTRRERVLLLGERHARSTATPNRSPSPPPSPWSLAAPSPGGCSGGVQEVANSPRRFRARIAPRRTKQRPPRKIYALPLRPCRTASDRSCARSVALAAVGATLSAQQQVVPGTNVNMVSGTTLSGRRSVPAAAERAVERGLDAQSPAHPRRRQRLPHRRSAGSVRSAARLQDERGRVDRAVQVAGWRPDLEEHAGARAFRRTFRPTGWRRRSRGVKRRPIR